MWERLAESQFGKIDFAGNKDILPGMATICNADLFILVNPEPGIDVRFKILLICNTDTMAYSSTIEFTDPDKLKLHHKNGERVVQWVKLVLTRIAC